MKLQDLPSVSEALFRKMESDRYSQSVIGTARWVLGHFGHFCEREDIQVVTLSAAARFTEECFGFDFIHPSLRIHSVIRRPLFILFEFNEYGMYFKTHKNLPKTNIPSNYGILFNEYRSYVNSLELAKPTRQKRLLVFTKYINYLDGMGMASIRDAGRAAVYDFVNGLDQYAPKTLRVVKSVLRSIYDWLSQNGYSEVSGTEVFPVIRDESRSKLVSYYSSGEISEMLSHINIGCPSGKFAYCALCFLAYLGMRASDVVSLRFRDIDWNNGIVHFSQFKTGAPLSLPLLDEVKIPLIDYIKNARNESEDTEHIFITLYAPYTPYSNGSILCNVVDSSVKTAGIATDGRHHGAHSLRHSLATNLMREDIPISGISDILGHSGTLVTESYLTVDETHLKELTLEVPDAED